MTLAARLAPHLPGPLVARAARLVYPRFEPELARLAEMCPADCGTAVDVGGWYGPWTHRLARTARRVVTVEPVPHLARLLAATTPAHVRVHQAAAGERAGAARLWLPPGDRGDRGIASLVRGRVHARAVDVTCLTLDGLGLHEVGFIKIDVDGGELAVLRGARRLLARDRPALFIELEHRINPVAPVLALLDELGYHGWVLPGPHWLPLAEFDLAAHQSRTAHVAGRGLLRRVLPAGAGPRYVNSVLFLAGSRRPGPL
ncbi:FkbM family methyltransferase [Streptomyces physcomitrii]|uniref:FkbM family methyltransferase n=1 Tax=Streptomyces physcomitrii TaxID=2724184 RepID=A0ABX1GXJ6_9ACTN|nr:FkbM family methyltransferase [Streptomyces physcomitrii]NKI40824.1 FkbM family methyltransferase [Streptomyces physcomitrii]